MTPAAAKRARRRQMRIAVDVCVGNRGAEILRDAGHTVIEAEHGESDRDWFARAMAADVELFVSGDTDIEILAYDANVRFVRARQGESGATTARRVLCSIRGKEFSCST